jgi:DNA-binding transcriptional MerR regulator
MGRPTIAVAARRAGVGIETIRFYERRGLIARPPRPVGGGYRAYDDGLIDRVRFIREAQELGFTLAEIGELLALRADPAADCRAVRERALGRLAEVERRLARLERMRAALTRLVESCPGSGALRVCTILEAMAHPAPWGEEEQEMETLVLQIEGMHCEGCARTLEALLAREAGVREVAVSFRAASARLLIDPKLAAPAALEATVARAGFRAAVEHR